MILPPHPQPWTELEKTERFCHVLRVSFAEMKDLLPTLTPDERASLLECLQAMEEKVSVEEFRAMKAAVREEITNPSPEYSIEEAEAELEKLGRGNAAAA